MKELLDLQNLTFGKSIGYSFTFDFMLVLNVTENHIYSVIYIIVFLRLGTYLSDLFSRGFVIS